MKAILDRKKRSMNHDSARRSCAGSIGRVMRVALLALMPALVVVSCGGKNDSDAVLLSGESHFLRRCTSSCGDGVDCISGICTRACIVNDTSSCSPFPGAVCTAASVEPGAVAVCDVACGSDADCSGLGDSHRCDAGFCRGDQMSSAEIPDCSIYRDQPGDADINVIIRNDRSTPVYLQPLMRCGGQPAALLTFNRPVLFEGARATCGSQWCQQIQDEGYTEPNQCPFDCLSRALVRMEPGAELDAGSFKSEAVWHGRSSVGNLPRMPDACFSGQDPQLLPGVECNSEVPMVGAYEVTAQAFANIECPPMPEPCECTPDAEGTCVTEVSTGTGEISASTTFETPVSMVVLAFR